MDEEFLDFILTGAVERFLAERFNPGERAELARPGLEEIESARVSGAAGADAARRRQMETADALFLSRLGRSAEANPDLFPRPDQITMSAGFRSDPTRFQGRRAQIAEGERESFPDAMIAEILLNDILSRADRETELAEAPNRGRQQQLAEGGIRGSLPFSVGPRAGALATQAGGVTLGDLAGLLMAGAADINLAERRSASALAQFARDINFLLQSSEAQGRQNESAAFNRARR